MRFLKKVVVCGFIVVIFLGVGTSLSGDTDPFYMKVFEEGKIHYAAGNFDEAELNFRIAEFGLLDEREVLKEVYPYYLLTLFQLGRLEEAREIIERFENELIVKDLNAITTPPDIKIPFKAMLATLRRIKQAGNVNAWATIYRFELLYLKVLRQLENNELDTVANNIARLETIDKKAPRLYYLRGILKFKQKDYKASIKELKNFEKVNSSSPGVSLQDSLYYHLCLSYYYLNKTKETARCYNKVADRSMRSELYRKITGENTRNSANNRH